MTWFAYVERPYSHSPDSGRTHERPEKTLVPQREYHGRYMVILLQDCRLCKEYIQINSGYKKKKEISANFFTRKLSTFKLMVVTVERFAEEGKENQPVR
jgi:hypothetical protein